MRRIFAEKQRASLQQSETFSWEEQTEKEVAWQPKYEDERKFYYASKVEEGVHHLDASTLQLYLAHYGSRYMLGKHLLRSGRELPKIKMHQSKNIQFELLARSNVLNYWCVGRCTTGTLRPPAPHARTSR